MRRVSMWGAAAAAAFGLAACGDARVVESPLAGASGCASCHTAPGEGPPFRDQTGSTDPFRLTVGAHDAHLHGNLVASISCGQCHTVPSAIDAPGHLQDSPTDIAFGPLPRTGGANPKYEATGCAATYCHGNFPGGNASNTPLWLGGAGAASCGTCHGLPPATGRHEAHTSRGIACTTCHGFRDAGNPDAVPVFLQSAHVNGVKDVPLPAWRPSTPGAAPSCAAACHEARTWRDSPDS